MMEVRIDEGTFDEVEDLRYISDDALVSGHQHEVGVEAGCALVEVARANTGDISPLRADVDELGVYLELLVSQYDVDPRVLHLLPPADIGLLVEAS